MSAPLQLPTEYAELAAEKERLSKRIGEILMRRNELRKVAMNVAGWKRCCRCFPRCVGDDGFCGCCCFNQITGKSLDFDAEPDASAPQEPPKP